MEHEQIDVNAKDHTGCTPLILGSHAGHLNIIRELLKHPMVDLNAEDYKGATALTVAIGKEEGFGHAFAICLGNG